MNLPPFYVGQKVVALEDHHQATFNKGDVFTILGIRKPCCVWVIDIGLCNIYLGCKCNKCGHIEFGTPMAWFDVSGFAPIEENFQSITLEKVLEQETKLVSVN